MLLSMLMGFLIGLGLGWWLLPRQRPTHPIAHEWLAYGQDPRCIPRHLPGPPARDGCPEPGAFAAPDLTPGRIYLHAPP